MTEDRPHASDVSNNSDDATEIEAHGFRWNYLRNLKRCQGRVSEFGHNFASTLSGSVRPAPRRFWLKFGRYSKQISSIVGLLAIAFLAVQTVGIHARPSGDLWPVAAFVIVAVIAGSFLWFIPRKQYIAIFKNTFGWLPVSLGAASYYYWYWYASQSGVPESDFFHASADVLPILLLASILDVHRSESLESNQLILPIIAVFLGEIAALNALAFGDAGAADFAAVASSLVTSIFALILAVMADLPEETNNERQDNHVRPVEHSSEPASQESVTEEGNGSA